MPEMVYPALFYGADDASRRAQRLFLMLSAGEYIFLILAAILGLRVGLGLLPKPIYLSLYALVFMLFIAVLLYRTANKPEDTWYQCRALAESIKTSAWRYCMHAPPFADGKGTRAEFRKYLAEILEANRHIGHRITEIHSEGGQVTSEMDAIRALPMKERHAFYVTHRIRDQQAWYSRKASIFRRRVHIWVGICLTLFVLAAATVLLEVAEIEPPIPNIAWPTEPLIVAASSVLGWMQVKKFNELASAYSLTAHEIGLLIDQAEEHVSDKEFAAFVNQAELAFSREHTQWVARQVSVG